MAFKPVNPGGLIVKARIKKISVGCYEGCGPAQIAISFVLPDGDEAFSIIGGLAILPLIEQAKVFDMRTLEGAECYAEKWLTNCWNARFVGFARPHKPQGPRHIRLETDEEADSE